MTDPTETLRARVEEWNDFDQEGDDAKSTALINDLFTALSAASQRAAAAEQDAETERIRLAACTTAALSNTPERVAERLQPGHPYYSASYGDVCKAVDREMAYRAAVETLRQERGWQPIETAPKDGSRMWLWNGYRRAIGWFKGYDDGSDGWHRQSLIGEGLGRRDIDPETHWMPLPDSPVPCGAPAPDGSPRSCDLPVAHQGAHWSHEGRMLKWVD